MGGLHLSWVVGGKVAAKHCVKAVDNAVEKLIGKMRVGK